jgi:SAM-dependent methyltransferase
MPAAVHTTIRVQEDYWESITERRSPFHPVVTAFAEPKVRFIREAINASGSSMLEVGAGSGFFSAALCRAFDLWCLDFSENMLALNPMPPDRKIQGLAEKLPFPDESYDIVFCGNLLHHLESPLDAVREMKRVAKRHVVLVEPNAVNPLMFLFGVLKKPERGTLKFTSRYLKGLGTAAGLELKAFLEQGMILPNKTPKALLPLMTRVDRPNPLGFYLCAVFTKPS